ncbi:FAD-binding domain-containing protein [Ekhidna sp. To15]|uniref:FAD-binding domain-containing protein n=1 Tax=Ekhidna sp. To15 TaxID=3395267 RepID=UPI003F524BE7
MFPASYQEILDRIDSIDPEAYGKTRNFIDGAVTKLSPYISRGVISTRQVLHAVLIKGYQPDKIEKFIQELAWRDYWQQAWIDLGDSINKDVRRDQPNVKNHEMPDAILNAETQIETIDSAINELYSHGYLHNHVRMYIASIACNVGRSYWKVPAQWMYYHLLDGDWASNALSWQWVAGANAGKQYYANQENINKYCYTSQNGTFLDVDYSRFEEMQIPEKLKETTIPELITPLPILQELEIDSSKPTLIYNFYNLDPKWHEDGDVNRVLLLEPSVFEKYPVSKKSIEFTLNLSENINGIQVFVGEFQDLKVKYELNQIIFKEHPLNHYQGIEEPRDWMFNVTGYYRSFFAFWKKCKRNSRHGINQPCLAKKRPSHPRSCATSSCGKRWTSLSNHLSV